MFRRGFGGCGRRNWKSQFMKVVPQLSYAPLSCTLKKRNITTKKCSGNGACTFSILFRSKCKGRVKHPKKVSKCALLEAGGLGFYFRCFFEYLFFLKSARDTARLGRCDLESQPCKILPRLDEILHIFGFWTVFMSDTVICLGIPPSTQQKAPELGLLQGHPLRVYQGHLGRTDFNINRPFLSYRFSGLTCGWIQTHLWHSMTLYDIFWHFMTLYDILCMSWPLQVQKLEARHSLPSQAVHGHRVLWFSMPLFADLHCVNCIFYISAV